MIAYDLFQELIVPAFKGDYQEFSSKNVKGYSLIAYKGKWKWKERQAMVTSDVFKKLQHIAKKFTGTAKYKEQNLRKSKVTRWYINGFTIAYNYCRRYDLDHPYEQMDFSKWAEKLKSFDDLEQGKWNLDKFRKNTINLGRHEGFLFYIAEKSGLEKYDAKADEINGTYKTYDSEKNNAQNTSDDNDEKENATRKPEKNSAPQKPNGNDKEGKTMTNTEEDSTQDTPNDNDERDNATHKPEENNAQNPSIGNEEETRPINNNNNTATAPLPKEYPYYSFFNKELIQELYNNYNDVIFKRINSFEEFNNIILRKAHTQHLSECDRKRMQMYNILYRLSSLPPKDLQDKWLEDIATECGYSVVTIKKKHTGSDSSNDHYKKEIKGIDKIFDKYSK